jgi:DivIVA domain-containing protein
VDGNEVRRLVFPQSRGYDTAAVDELLDRIAAELDAGRPVAHLIEDATLPRQSAQLRRGFRGGYAYASVDGVLSQLRRQDDPEARADPWGNLPAWRYSMASPDASTGDLTGPARHGAAMLRVGHVKAAKGYARECAEAYRDFGAQPGTQLGLVRKGVGRWELRTAEQYVLVSARTVPSRTFGRDGHTYRLSRVRAAQWPAVAAEIGGNRPGSPAHLPRTEPDSRTGAEAARSNGAVATKDFTLKSLSDPTGPPVLYTGGGHIDRSPGGYVQFPGRRWLQFPVRGTGRSNAIMTAVDQAGRQVAKYMIGDRRMIHITVHPDQRLTHELILTLALTGRWVSSYFDSSGGGG